MLMVQVSPSEIIPHVWTSQYIAIDTEGTDIKKTDLRAGTGWAYGGSVACRPVGQSKIYSAYFPIKHTVGNVSDDLIEAFRLMTEKHERVVYHNAKHDILALRTMDIERSTNFYDTMLMAHWLHEEFTFTGLSLDWCTKHFLDEDDGKKNKGIFEEVLKVVGWSPDFPAELMGEYAAYDTELTLRLFEYLYPFFKKQGFDG